MPSAVYIDPMTTSSKVTMKHTICFTEVPISRVSSNHSAMSETVFRAPPVNQPSIAVASPSSHQGLLSAAKAFKACMCDLDDLNPSKLALNLFSKEVIDEAEFTSIQELMMSTKKDEMVICNEILFKVYNSLKVDVDVYPRLQEVLTKLKPETARKLKSEIGKWSRNLCILCHTCSVYNYYCFHPNYRTAK